MQNKTILHDLKQQKAFLKQGSFVDTMSKESDKVPFQLLQAFVEGTGDLFHVDLRTKIGEICRTFDVKGYMELSDQLDAEIPKYSNSIDIDIVKGHRVLCSLLKKYEFSPKFSPYKPKATAIEKWYAAEAQCGETNARLRNWIDNVSLRPSWVHRARAVIQDVIGESITPELMKEILSSAYHGKGTSTETPFEASSAYFKYANPNPHSTTSALPYVMAAISRNPRWFANLERSQACQVCDINRAKHEEMIMRKAIRITEQERNSFVNKTVKVLRIIGIGNSSNMCVQLGVKTVLMRMLKACSIDLSDQSKNRELAYQGSLEGTYAEKGSDDWLEQLSTIDLASASDTVSLGICELLLPTEWFALLCDLRHESGMIDGTNIVYNKMSAMGNGFTFPLESLIFYSILKATTEDQGYEYDTSRNAVYGDDLICPYKVTTALIDNLTVAGFTINSEKSFLTGMFKESCGRDYFQGVNVRPFYLKRALTSTEDFYHVGNTLVSHCSSFTAVAPGYKSMYGFIHTVLKLTGHINYGPLTELLTFDKEGKRVWCASETALSVPLAYYKANSDLGAVDFRTRIAVLNDKQFLPRMSKKHKNAYITHMMDMGTTLFMHVTTSYEPLAFKHVSEETRLLCAFDSDRDCNARPGQYDKSNLDIDANGTIVPVVKRCIRHSCSLRSHSHWNGIMRRSAIERHPLG